MKLVLVVLACLLGLSLGAAVPGKPHHCKSPPLMTGAFTFTSQNEKALFYAPYEYDAFGERIRIVEFGTYQNHSFINDVLLLYREGVMYQIDYNTSTCTKQPLKADFVPLEVPPNAELVGSAVLGGSSEPGEGVFINTWGGHTPEGGKYLMSMTQVHCFPVSIMAQTKDYGWVTLTYLDGVQGIVDPSALIPPPFCPGRHVMPQGRPMDFFSIVKNMAKRAQ